jgi:HEPN domain-containing protein
MTGVTLAHSYFDKARKRLRALSVLFEDGAFSDVVREAQELVELVLKGILRFVGIEPPKQHDVGRLLLQHRERFPVEVTSVVERLADISHRLRKERESRSMETKISSLRRNTPATTHKPRSTTLALSRV